MDKAVFARRVQRCADQMAVAGLDALLLTKPANMYYLTGDGRLCAYTLVTREAKVAMGVPKTDLADVKALARFDRIEGFEDEVGMIHSIAHFFQHFAISSGSVGLEYTFLTRSMMGMLTHPHAKPEKVEVQDCTSILSALRLVKEPEELERIRAAARLADRGMAAAIAGAKAGRTESQVAAEAEYALRQAGAEGFWRTYVSSGPRTSIAHGLPGSRRLERGELVMIDVHPILEGYSADICRTVCVGKPSAEQQQAYALYLEAQQAAIGLAKAGVGLAELEAKLHGVLKDAGHGEHVFGPPIHGVGIEFEEAPLPAGHAFFHGEKAPPPLAANVVLAVGNCGLYAGPWGVRVEDTLIVGEAGPEVLTQTPRRLAA
jgi:Xaa-Pro aminopeptidase